jgi:hypothetical protein
MPFANDVYRTNNVAGWMLCNILYSFFNKESHNAQIFFHSVQLPYKPKCSAEIVAQKVGSAL